MSAKDTSRFKPYNVKAITQSFKKTIDDINIEHLTKDAYKFATLYFDFIAHYNHDGFKATYQDDMPAYIRQIANASVDRYKNDKWFANEYGDPYVKSIYDIGSVVIPYARAAKDRIQLVQFERDRNKARDMVTRLKNKYDL